MGQPHDDSGPCQRTTVEVGLRPDQRRNIRTNSAADNASELRSPARWPRDPQLIVLDEPVSALDVSIRAQMMNLLKDIQARDNVAYLLVAHDLATVRYMANNTIVMYLGKIVEAAPTAALFEEVAHPYTKALLSAVVPPRPDQPDEEIVLAGEVPSPLIRQAVAGSTRVVPSSCRVASMKSQYCIDGIRSSGRMPSPCGVTMHGRC